MPGHERLQKPTPGAHRPAPGCLMVLRGSLWFALFLAIKKSQFREIQRKCFVITETESVYEALEPRGVWDGNCHAKVPVDTGNGHLSSGYIHAEPKHHMRTSLFFLF